MHNNTELYDAFGELIYVLAMADGNLAYLDFGMMSEVKPYQRYGLIEAVGI